MKTQKLVQIKNAQKSESPPLLLRYFNYKKAIISLSCSLRRQPTSVLNQKEKTNRYLVGQTNISTHFIKNKALFPQTQYLILQLRIMVQQKDRKRQQKVSWQPTQASCISIAPRLTIHTHPHHFVHNKPRIPPRLQPRNRIMLQLVSRINRLRHAERTRQSSEATQHQTIVAEQIYRWHLPSRRLFWIRQRERIEAATAGRRHEKNLAGEAVDATLSRPKRDKHPVKAGVFRERGCNCDHLDFASLSTCSFLLFLPAVLQDDLC